MGDLYQERRSVWKIFSSQGIIQFGWSQTQPIVGVEPTPGTSQIFTFAFVFLYLKKSPNIL